MPFFHRRGDAAKRKDKAAGSAEGPGRFRRSGPGGARGSGRSGLWNKPGRLKKFFSYYRPYTRLFLADMLCAVVVSIVSLIFPLCVRHITGNIPQLGPDHSGRALLLFSLLLAGLIILQTSCALFYDHMGHVMGARIERDMRNELFARYQSLPFSFFDREKTGSILSRLTSDLLSLAELYHHGPEDLIIYALTFVGALLILFRLNMGLALVISAFLPFMVLFSLVYGAVLNRVYTRNLEYIAAINTQIEDSIGGIRTVKAFGNEGLEIEKFKKANEAYYQSRSSIYKQEARYFTGMGELSGRLIMAAAVLGGGLMLSKASLSIADFISFILYVSYLTAPIPQLARISAQYQQGISGFNRFMDVMELPGEGYRGTGSGGPVRCPKAETGRAAGRGEVEFVNVGFSYGEGSGPILKNVSFKVKAGEVAALTGPSGIGKTTLCSLIPRFYDSYTGDIFIDGRDIRERSLRELRAGIGIVQQDTYIFSGTIAENIAYGKPGASPEEIMAAARRANAHEFIMVLPGGYETPIGSRGLTLSGGQKQRIAIARVFLRDPPLLIFDEATSALDYEGERIIREGLESLSANRTTIVIAHRLSTISTAARVFALGEEGIEESR
jgi:ATP-binding cassette subfamily B protein